MEKKNRTKFAPLLVALALLITSVTGAIAAPARQAEKDIVDIAVEDGRFTTLVTALQAADLVDTLKGEGPFTVFAPTDEAFAALPEGTLDSLLNDIPALTDVLLYHVVPGQVMAADVVSLDSADTVLGQSVDVNVDGETVNINEASVIITDIEASNGVIHVIDSVLLPPGDDSAMMEGSEVAACSQDYVVQADDWLSKIAEKFYGDALAYPIIFDATNAAAASGGYDSIADPNVIEVGQTLCIPAGGMEAGSMEESEAGQTIVDVAVADGRFSTLVTALQAAGLVETLSGEGPFTVFAPTDEAFAALPEGTLDGLLADIPALTDVLLYHVVSGEVMAADVVNLDTADTVLGQPVDISVESESVEVNDSNVIITDIEASNGVIHVIDSVLLPPSDDSAMMEESAPDIVDIAAEDGRFTTLVTALQAADLVDTLKGEGPFTVFAPTDEAFAALPEGTLDSLLNDIPALTDVLLYHVVPGQVMAADVVSLDAADTVLGQPVDISVEGESVKVNDANVIITDIEASNGVIHVIDAVILPPQ